MSTVLSATFLIFKMLSFNSIWDQKMDVITKNRIPHSGVSMKNISVAKITHKSIFLKTLF